MSKNRIEELRKKRGMGQKELAEKIETSQQAISLYERGDREPKLETWQKLASFFGVSVPYLQGIEAYSENDIFKIMQDSYKHGTKVKNYTVNGVINLDLSDVLIRGAIDQLMLVRSVSSYLENKKRGAKPSKIEISKNDASNLDFWKKNFSFMLNDPSIKLLLKTGKEQKLEVKRIIANVINLEVNQEINQYSHEEFFKGMSDFIKAKQIATPEDQNNLANTGVLTMLDMLGRKPKIETWKRLKALDISTEDFKVNARLDIEKPVIDEEGEKKNARRRT